MKDKFFNRDLSWVEFNARILDEGCRKENPLIEQLRFLCIVSTNFDEFFQVRVASLKRTFSMSPGAKDLSGLSLKEILDKISQRSHQITETQYSVLKTQILPELAKSKLIYVSPENLTQQQISYTQNLFQREVFPILTPLRAEKDNFPHITNQAIHAAFLLKPIEGIHIDSPIIKTEGNENIVAIVQIPTSVSRIVYLPSSTQGKSFTILDEIICRYGTQLFPGYNATETMLFSVARDSDFGVDEDSGDQFIEAMEEVLVKRQTSIAVRMVCNNTSETLLQILKTNLDLADEDIYKVDGPIHPEFLTKLSDTKEGEKLCYSSWKNYYPLALKKDEPIWDTLHSKDILIHVPYESFDPVVKFVSDAAVDPDVLAIKMTLYRTEKDSAIVRALEKAAQNGKQVTAFVELKARFDEERNIGWATRLERAGVIVIYGIVNLKVHGKTLMIVRREEDSVRRYVHLSTGNYNANTAKVYSDLSLFTANAEIANDVTLLFNLISGYSSFQTMKHIFMAPVNLKSQLLMMIEREMDLSTPQNPGLIIAKMNSLGHEEVIKALYKASKAGVKVMINVRGICQLIPGVKDMSENISVVSIVGRYLEHSRIVYFQNGGAEEIYLSSADWMVRNLDKRIELMFPITDPIAFATVKNTLNSYFKDNTNSFTLLPDGTWRANKPDVGERPYSVQNELHAYYQKLNEAAQKQPKTEFTVRRK